MTLAPLLLAIATQGVPEAGTYLLEAEVEVEQQVPVAGTFRSDIRTRSLLQVEPDGSARYRMCGLLIDDDNAFASVRVPPRLLRYTRERPARFARRGESWSLDLGTGGLGTWRDAVYDQDRDGHPGVTVELDIRGVGLLSLDVAQSWQLELFPERVDADGVIVGELVVRRWEQRVLGTRPVSIGIAGEASASEKAHGFRLWPVAPGTTCSSNSPLPRVLPAATAERSAHAAAQRPLR